MSESEDEKPLGSRRLVKKEASVNPDPGEGVKMEDGGGSGKTIKKETAIRKTEDGNKKAPAKKEGTDQTDRKKGKTSTQSTKDAENEETEKKRKEFDMPGQTKETPQENDSLRKFYVSTLQQKPESEMAKKWCLQYGLLEREEAEAYAAEVLSQRRAPVKSPSKARSVSPQASNKRRKTESESRGNAGSKKSTANATSQRAANGKAKRSNRKIVYEEAQDEDSDDSEDERPLKERKKGDAASKTRPKQEAKKEKDGDTDSDDDKPLGERNAAKPLATAGPDVKKHVGGASETPKQEEKAFNEGAEEVKQEGPANEEIKQEDTKVKVEDKE